MLCCDVNNPNVPRGAPCHVEFGFKWVGLMTTHARPFFLFKKKGYTVTINDFFVQNYHSQNWNDILVLKIYLKLPRIL